MDYIIFIKEFKSEDWENYVSICNQDIEIIEELISSQEFELKIPEDVKKVACYKLKSQASSWFYLELPLINGTRPIDLLDMNDGLIVIKEILLRIPA
ncbi:MAG: hypothetical protein K0S41_1848 [Anaerocolumna sp.]|jgi:hypothetical protein|nr:hypothetical protein [Anaerocolumna sp.]